MRDFFIGAFERIITVVILLGALVVLAAGIGAMSGPRGGVIRGLVILIAGGIYLLLGGGLAYLGLGIYHNTRRTADALGRLATRGEGRDVI